MPEIKEGLKKDLITLYERYFGSTTAENYLQFYADKDTSTILASATELMIEYAGESKGTEIMDQIYTKYNLKKN